MWNPFRKAKQQRRSYDQEVGPARQKFNALVEEARITNELDHCSSLLEGNAFDNMELLDGAPYYTKAGIDARESQRESRFQLYRDALRKVIFAIPDERVRKGLIAADQEFHAARLRYFENELFDAEKRRNKPNDVYALYLVLGTFIGVIILWELAGPMGGTASAAALVVSSVYDMRHHDVAKQAASEELSRLEENIERVAAEQVFDRYDE